MNRPLTNSILKALIVFNSMLALVSVTNVAYSQNELYGQWSEVGLDISSSPAIGFNLGYVNYGKAKGAISYISGYVLMGGAHW